MTVAVLLGEVCIVKPVMHNVTERDPNDSLHSSLVLDLRRQGNPGKTGRRGPMPHV